MFRPQNSHLAQVLNTTKWCHCVFTASIMAANTIPALPPEKVTVKERISSRIIQRGVTSIFCSLGCPQHLPFLIINNSKHAWVNFQVLYFCAISFWPFPARPALLPFAFVCRGGDADGRSNVSISKSSGIVGMLSIMLFLVYLGRN